MEKSWIWRPLMRFGFITTNGMVPNDDDKPKEGHEDVEFIHNMVVVEDCSTSW